MYNVCEGGWKWKETHSSNWISATFGERNFSKTKMNDQKKFFN